MAARALPLPKHLEALRLRPDAPASREARAIPTGIADLDELLPDGGLLRGSVTELSAAQGLGLGTTIALSVVAAAQAESRNRGGDSAYCAFLDPAATLHGPGARALGVDLAKLLVVRPPADALARTASRIVASRVFSVVVVDTGGVPGATVPVSLASWVTVVRRLALAAESGDTAVLLLTRSEAARPLPLPVAMRVELVSPQRGRLSARIGKERRGLVGGFRSIHLETSDAASRARTA